MIYPIQRIVAAVGELDADDLVLKEGIALAKRLGATLHLVHAHDIPPLLLDSYASIGYAAPADPVGSYREAVQTRLEELARSEGALEGTVYHVIPGAAADAIHTVAEEADADLVLVGATRRGRLGKLLLGTTAQRVLRGTSLPVMVVRSPIAERPARVLVTSDLTETSAGVHELGLDVLEAISAGEGSIAEVRSLAVADTGPLPTGLRPDEIRQITLQHIEKTTATLRPRQGKIEAAARVGDPAGEIAAEAEEWRADYVVIGTHSRPKRDRRIAGSVAQAAVRTISSSNVLIVPAGSEAKR